MAGPGLTAMGIESFSIYNLLILQGLGKSKKNETAVKSIILRHDVRSIAREASAAPAASFKSPNRTRRIKFPITAFYKGESSSGTTPVTFRGVSFTV